MIERLEIENFRTIASAAVDLAKVNVFFGPMGAGKSSCKAAIEYMFNRRNEWTNGRGDGLKTQVRHGAKTGRLRMKIGKYTEEAPVPPESAYKGAIGRLYHCLGLTGPMDQMETRVNACLRACSLLDLADADQKSVFCGALQLDLNADNFTTLVNSLDDRWPGLAQWLDERTGESAKPPAMTFDGWAKYAREMRYGVKQLRQDVLRRVEELERKVGGRASDGSPEKAAEVRARRDEVLRQLADLDGAESPRVAAYEAELTAWRLVADARDAAGKRLAEADRKLLDAQDAADAATPGRAAEELEEERKAARLAADAARATVAAEIQSLEEEQQSALDVDPHADHQCVAGTCCLSLIAQQTEEAARRRQALAEALSGARKRDREIADEWARRDDVLRQEWEQAFKGKLKQSEVREWEYRVGEARKAFDATPEPGAAPARPVSSDAERARLSQQLEQLTTEAQLEDARSIQAQVVEHEQGELTLETQRLADLDEQCEIWELLVRAFEPTKDPVSLPTRLLREGISELAAAVDATCRANFRFGVQFEFEPWGLHLVLPSGLVPQRQASGGERVLLSSVIQVELARRTGFPVIMIDEAQRVDALMRGPLLRYLQAQDVQALMFMAAQDKDSPTSFRRPPAPQSSSLAFFWVESGVITRMGAAAAVPG